MNREITRILKDIKAVKIQGARDVAEAGIICLKIAAQKSTAGSKGALVSEMQAVARAVLDTRPTEPELNRCLNTILVKTRNCEPENPELVRKYAIRACENYMHELDMILRKIADIGARHIRDGDVILMQCHSDTVASILREAQKQGKAFRTIVTETEPLCQGIATAKELLKYGIKVTYGVDAVIGYVMKDVTRVLVGCDAILGDGSIVNKIGTLPIAIVARHFRKPFMAAGETMKFSRKVPEIEQRPPKEVINPGLLPKAEIINPAFDVTPAEFIDLIITEKGAVKPGQIAELLL